MGLDVEALRGSFELLVERNGAIVHRFYEVLFERHPALRPLFSRNRPEVQEKMLTGALVAVMDHLEDGAWLTSQLHAMGAKHVDYGVTDEMYGWVGESLLAALEEVAADDWTPRIEKAWKEALGAIAGLMLEGARQSRVAAE
jgi:hemoglobin-like flavoprotein